MRKEFKFFSQIVITIILTLGLSISFQSLLAAWTVPTANPPADNPSAPIYSNSATDQTITGGSLTVSNGLVVGTGLVMASNVILHNNWLSGDGGNEGISIDVEGNIKTNGYLALGTPAAGVAGAIRWEPTSKTLQVHDGNGWVAVSQNTASCPSTFCTAPHTIGSCPNTFSSGSCTTCTPDCGCEGGYASCNGTMADGCETFGSCCVAECAYVGQTQCSGSTLKTCANVSGCLKWSDSVCSYGCASYNGTPECILTQQISRCWSAPLRDHRMVVGGAAACGAAGYTTPEGTVKIPTKAYPGTVQIFECRKFVDGYWDYMSSTNCAGEGFAQVTSLGYTYSPAPLGFFTVPMYRCWVPYPPLGYDHFLSWSNNCEGAPNNEGNFGYYTF